MDVDLAHTFLAVAETGTFSAAGERLNVTQSTVSARVRELERQLGRRLFTRSKAGAQPTSEGERFRRHAEAFVALWRAARDDIALPPGHRRVLACGAQVSLWEGLLVAWVGWMRDEMTETALRCEAGTADYLVDGLTAGRLDFALLYAPERRPGVEVEALFEEEVVLASTAPVPEGQPPHGYVEVDWGPGFRAWRRRHYPEAPIPGLAIALGAIALDHVLRAGGAGFFPRRVVAPLATQGLLIEVPGAPVYRRPAYLARRAGLESEADVARALAALRRLAQGRQP